MIFFQNILIKIVWASVNIFFNFAHFNFKFFAMVYDLNWTKKKLAQANPGILRKNIFKSTDVEALKNS